MVAGRAGTAVYLPVCFAKSRIRATVEHGWSAVWARAGFCWGKSEQQEGTRCYKGRCELLIMRVRITKKGGYELLKKEGTINLKGGYEY